MWEFWRGRLDSSGRSSPRPSVTSPGLEGRRSLPPVNFKDLNLSVDDELDSEDQEGGFHAYVDEDPTNKSAIIRTKSLGRLGAVKNKLIIVMVGLPGRGKTFLCNKLKCYLNWLGHDTAHFNVGNYRRKQKGADEVQDAAFFDSHNPHGLEARNRALQAALDDVLRYLSTDAGQVAIFDATNTTNERRQLLRETFHGKYQYMFIESMCNDHETLERNYRYKMKFSPDYAGVDMEAALNDFKDRIKRYDEVYETINDRTMHYIKLIDMVTGRGHMDVNRISGYIPGKIVFFLMQVCKAGMTAGQTRKIWLTRHGESEWNRLAKIGGDSNLTERGQEYARMLPELLDSRLPATFNETGIPVSVWTSTLKRTIATANYLPYPKLRWKALDEIHAGVCDGMTYEEINSKFPEDYEARKKDKLRYRYPAGESYLDVIQRLEPVIIEMEREREYVLVVGHQAILRAIYGYFMAVPLKDIPTLDMPLHTLIELQPRPDGTMDVCRVPAPMIQLAGSGGSGGGGITLHFPPPPDQLPVQVPLGSSPLEALAQRRQMWQQQQQQREQEQQREQQQQQVQQQQALQQQQVQQVAHTGGGAHRRCASTSAITHMQPGLRAIQTGLTGMGLPPALQHQLESSIAVSSNASAAELAAHSGSGSYPLSCNNSIVSVVTLADGVAGVPSPFAGYVDASCGTSGPGGQASSGNCGLRSSGHAQGSTPHSMPSLSGHCSIPDRSASGVMPAAAAAAAAAAIQQQQQQGGPAGPSGQDGGGKQASSIQPLI